MKTIVSIPGMHCRSCAALIRDASGQFRAIRHLTIDLSNKEVTLEHDRKFDFRSWAASMKNLDERYDVQTIR